MFLLGTLFIFCSCVDDTYDLANKEISTDVEIKDNKLALPLGTLRPIFLESFLSDIDILDTIDNGVYCINRYDEILIEHEVQPVLLAINSKHITQTLTVPSTGTSTNINGLQKSASLGTKQIPFEMSKDAPFDHKEIFNQFMCIHSFSFKEDMLIELNIRIDGFEALQESLVNLDFTINFAPFFEITESEDSDVTIDKDNTSRVHIKKPYPTDSNKGLTINLYCDKFNFDNEFPQKGLTLEDIENGYQSHITTTGHIVMDCNNAELDVIQQINQVDMNVNCTFAPAYVKIANGKFKDNFEKGVSTFNFNIAERLASLTEGGAYITLSEPQIEIELQNSICMQTNVDVHVIGKNEEGEIMPSTEIMTSFPLDKGEYDNSKGEIIPHITKVLFTSTEELFKDGYTNEKVDQLRHLLEQFPDSMIFTVHPKIDYTYDTPHIIDLDHSFSFNAPYHMVIPLKFDSLHVCYSDTILLNLDTTLDMFTNAGLAIKMNVTNTIPLSLQLNITALDKEDKPIDDITIESFTIEAGDGSNIAQQQEGEKQLTPVTLGIKSATGDFSKFNKLKFTVESFNVANQTATLKETQGILLSNVAIEVSGDVSINMNE